MRNLGFTWLDVVALFWFFAWWVGYSVGREFGSEALTSIKRP